MEKFIVHENYNSKTVDNDIAMIILKEPVMTDTKVGTVCLPNPKEDIEDILYSGCYITGKFHTSKGYSFYFYHYCYGFCTTKFYIDVDNKK